MSTTVTTRILHVPENHKIAAPHRPWLWPLPRLDGVAPSIVAPQHDEAPQGVEIGYQARSSSPGLVPVFAVQNGIIAYAGTGEAGPTLCIDHPGGWSTQYSELEHLLARPTDRFRRRRKERVRAGDVIGHVRRSTLRLRFALSRLIDDGCVEQDPTAWMPAWSMLPWFVEPTPRIATRAAV
jgi:murein DD-endopeptidase MepM/ murein hydrolase activator NlpD